MNKRARVSDIITAASELADVPIAAILGKGRKRVLVHVRQAIVMVARMQRPQPSFPQMGVLMHRDHSTLVHAFDKVLAVPDEARDLFIARLAEKADEVAIFAPRKDPHPLMRDTRGNPQPRRRPPPAMSQADRDELAGNAFIDMMDAGSAAFLQALRAA